MLKAIQNNSRVNKALQITPPRGIQRPKKAQVGALLSVLSLQKVSWFQRVIKEPQLPMPQETTIQYAFLGKFYPLIAFRLQQIPKKTHKPQILETLQTCLKCPKPTTTTSLKGKRLVTIVKLACCLESGVESKLTIGFAAVAKELYA